MISWLNEIGNCFERIAPVASVCVARVQYEWGSQAQIGSSHHEWMKFTRKMPSNGSSLRPRDIKFWKIQSVCCCGWARTICCRLELNFVIELAPWSRVGWMGLCVRELFSSPVMDYVKNNTYSELGKSMFALKRARSDFIQHRFQLPSWSYQTKNEIHNSHIYLVAHSALSCSVIRKICTWT